MHVLFYILMPVSSILIGTADSVYTGSGLTVSVLAHTFELG